MVDVVVKRSLNVWYFVLGLGPGVLLFIVLLVVNLLSDRAWFRGWGWSLVLFLVGALVAGVTYWIRVFLYNGVDLGVSYNKRSDCDRMVYREFLVLRSKKLEFFH